MRVLKSIERRLTELEERTRRSPAAGPGPLAELSLEEIAACRKLLHLTAAPLAPPELARVEAVVATAVDRLRAAPTASLDVATAERLDQVLELVEGLIEAARGHGSPTPAPAPSEEVRDG